MAKRTLSTFERLPWRQKPSRRERKEIERRFQDEDPGWDIAHENVAGIDVGNESHFVAIDPKLDSRPAQEFGPWTAALREVTGCWQGLGTKRVVPPGTGVYWIPLQDVREQAGLEVAMAEARGTKNLPVCRSEGRNVSGFANWTRVWPVAGLLPAASAPATPSGCPGNATCCCKVD